VRDRHRGHAALTYPIIRQRPREIVITVWPMTFSLMPLLLHSLDLPANVREALQAAHASEPEERDDRLVAAARLMHRETQLECADVRELVGLPPGCC